MMLGEAIVFLRTGLGGEVAFLRKQSMQLASKMRFLAAQFEVLLTDDLWRRPAAHANAMAGRLADAVGAIEGVKLTQRVEANAVFALLPPNVTEELQQRWHFYVWDENTGEVRWMCSWDTTEEDVDAFAADLAAAMTTVSA
jgi:threonine aldolase